MKLRVGQRYLASDRKGKPTFYFTPQSHKQNRLYYRMLREGVITITMACLLLAVALPTRAQYPWSPKEEARCDHNAKLDLWDSVRIRPVSFTDFEGDTAYWKSEGVTVKVGSFVFADESKFYSDQDKEVNQLYLIKRKEHKWVVYYCDHCKAILRAYEVK